jgi:cytochrome c5
MKKTLSVVVVFAVVGVLGAAAVLRGQDEPLDPRIAAYDKGPAKIDVSKYPAEMQSNYKVFQTKCSKCHTVARAINCEFALGDEWERYVKRMMNKAGTFISPAEGKQIYDFAVYDSKTRKKALYDRKLKEAGK